MLGGCEGSQGLGSDRADRRGGSTQTSLVLRLGAVAGNRSILSSLLSEWSKSEPIERDEEGRVATAWLQQVRLNKRGPPLPDLSNPTKVRPPPTHGRVMALGFAFANRAVSVDSYRFAVVRPCGLEVALPCVVNIKRALILSHRRTWRRENQEQNTWQTST